MKRFFLFLILLIYSCQSVEIEKKKEVKILWPLPPEIPRVRFVDVLYSSADIEGKPKRGAKEILFGIDPKKSTISLERPMDVAIDSQGRILIVDSKNKGIHIYDKKNKKFEIYGIRGMGALGWPNSIDIDEEDNIYVTDNVKKKLIKYDKKGGFIGAYGNFENPVGVCIDKNNKRIYVVDSKLHKIFCFNYDGNLFQTIGERGVVEGQFNFPTFCDVDAEGNVYIVDTGNHRVQIMDKDFIFLGSFGSIGVHPGQFTRPKGVAVDKFGIIYVVDGAFGNVQMFNKSIQFLMPFSQNGNDLGNLILPIGIEVDNNSFIYVADYGNGRVQIFQLIEENVDK